MFKCPVCNHEYSEEVPDFCEICQWSFTPAVDLEQVRLNWARQQWQQLQLFKQEFHQMGSFQPLPQNRLQTEILSQVGSDFSDVSTRLHTLETQLKDATVERENLQNQLDWVLYYLELLNPERVSQTLDRLENWLDATSEPTVEQSEVGMDYQPLTDLLAAGDWKNSEEYTWQILLYLAGRQEAGWLQPEDIANFPSTDLKTIDQLWNYYSHGLFGLTVQQQIFESLEGDYPSFCDRVGWREGENWKYYEELNFSLNAPPGHLPVFVWRKRACYGMGSVTVAENLSLFIDKLARC